MMSIAPLSPTLLPARLRDVRLLKCCSASPRGFGSALGSGKQRERSCARCTFGIAIILCRHQEW